MRPRHEFIPFYSFFFACVSYCHTICQFKNSAQALPTVRMKSQLHFYFPFKERSRKTKIPGCVSLPSPLSFLGAFRLESGQVIRGYEVGRRIWGGRSGVVDL